MRRLIPLIALVLWLTCLPANAVSYLIQLKNGSEFITNRHWEEGDQIMFHQYGGIVGIQQDFVKDIKESSLVYRETIPERQTPLSPASQASPKPGDAQSKEPQEGSKNGGEKEEPVDFNYYKEKRRDLLERLDEAQKIYKEGLGTKDPETSEKARQEWVGYGTKIYQLGDELQKKNKGVMPDWWEKWER